MQINLILLVKRDFFSETNSLLEIKRGDLALEKRYLEKELVTLQQDDMKALLENRLTNVTKELGSRPGGEEKIGGKFPGIFSYYVGVRYYSYCTLINISF